MNTPHSVVKKLFFSRIEKDMEFFSYFNVSEATAMAIANERASAYLEESILRVVMECHPSVNLTEYGNDADGSPTFLFELTAGEKLLLSSLMYECYLERDMSYLKTLNVNYTATDLRVFDPSNARSTFMPMFGAVHEQNEYFIDIYKNEDRSTGQYKLVDFAAHDATAE